MTRVTSTKLLGRERRQQLSATSARTPPWWKTDQRPGLPGSGSSEVSREVAGTTRTCGPSRSPGLLGSRCSHSRHASTDSIDVHSAGKGRITSGERLVKDDPLRTVEHGADQLPVQRCLHDRAGRRPSPGRCSPVDRLLKPLIRCAQIRWRKQTRGTRSWR